jgi:hypothetical protein
MAASVPADAAAAFAQYDRNSSGAIEVDELKALLRDLGLLQGKGLDEVHTFVAQQFAMADRKSRDNKLDEAEFSAYFAKVRVKLAHCASCYLFLRAKQLETPSSPPTLPRCAWTSMAARAWRSWLSQLDEAEFSAHFAKVHVCCCVCVPG